MTDLSLDGAAIERRVLNDLKGFQRKTVDYVFNRLYKGSTPTRRFLVADEVGLGKTLVAKGVIAKSIRHLQQQGIERIDVVYICSNAEIAAQNVRRLNVTGNQNVSVSTRITLLPQQLERLNQQGINFISFTPGTSFDMKSKRGISQERAVILRLLEYALGEDLFHDSVLEVLRGGQIHRNFKWTVVNTPAVRSEGGTGLDLSLAAYFKEELSKHPGLIEQFYAFVERAGQIDPWEASGLIGELRATLARSCVDALEPDLVIIDEFQRFRELLHAPDQNNPDDLRHLAHKLFDQNDARVLMLSATPYKMFTVTDEEQENHYDDFLLTCRFLMGAEEAKLLEKDLRQFNGLLRSLEDFDHKAILERKKLIERRLRRFMTRTERLSVTTDRQGMLEERDLLGTKLEAGDLAAFAAADRMSRQLRAGDMVEYWKSAPYLLNFMGDYKLKRELRNTTAASEVPDDIVKAIEASPQIARTQLEGYEPLEPGNARLRGLSAETNDIGMWRLLWVPPSLPYYRGRGAYIDPQLQRATKRLVFSSWTMVPDAVASMLSYDAERQMMQSRHAGTRNSSEDRARLRGLLSIRRHEGQPAGMSTFAMLYPAVALAKLTDPLVIARDLGAADRIIDAEEVWKAASQRVERALAPWVAGTSPSGPEDHRWYWLAPLLLDRTRSNSRARQRTESWLAHSQVLRAPADDEGSAGDDETGAWIDHVAYARTIVANGTRALGLGKVPADLTEATTLLGLGAPGICALRALGRIAGMRPNASLDLLDAALRDGAVRIAWGFRGLFNIPEVMALLRGSSEQPHAVYWKRVAQEGFHGNLQAILDEYVHLLPEWLGHITQEPGKIALHIATHVAEAVSIRAATYRADEFITENGRLALGALPMRVRFALRFGQEIRDEGAQLHRSTTVRSAFNSPFWPFVLVSTSVGQEGLDFHQYCHAVVHWNLPLNPVDLEQREGRVHRYKGHAIRKNVAERHSSAAFSSHACDPWKAMFEDASRSVSGSMLKDIEPYWVYEGSARIQRLLPILPLSKDAVRIQRLKKSLALYRLVFGQPRQDDLMAYLQERVPPDAIEELSRALQIDLSPR